jgi:hypothetical protein
LNTVRFHLTGAPIAACQIVEPADGDNCFDFEISAHDPAGHLLSYAVQALWGVNQSQAVASDSYGAHVNEHGPHLWNGPGTVAVPADGWEASADCAHTFVLDVWKRTIDGYNRILHRRHHQSVTLANIAAPVCSSGAGMGSHGGPASGVLLVPFRLPVRGPGPGRRGPDLVRPRHCPDGDGGLSRRPVPEATVAGVAEH